tara:strand:- start:1498 stop:1659 length:162 start_codon:yes stop_codon:yes gene_type:complete
VLLFFKKNKSMWLLMLKSIAFDGYSYVQKEKEFSKQIINTNISDKYLMVKGAG